MKKVYIKGYVSYDNENYTFIYEEKKLTLISVNNHQTFFNEYKYVDEFKGFTIDGFDIIFYINNNIYYKDGSFICSPRCIFVSRNKSYELDNMKFDSLRVSGGIINRFYSNRNMIEFDPKEKDYFKIKDVKETISEENVNLNGDKTTFEFSIMKPGWKDDGIITFNNYDSLLRIKYDIKKDYKSIIKDLNSIDKFFKFSANRVNISFGDILLELKNEDDKYEKAVEIIIPYMTNNEINKNILDYIIFKDHLNEIFKFLDNCDYIFSIIPEDNKSFGIISNKDYCACFSCFESIYQYVHGSNDGMETMKEEVALEEVKEEILPLLKNVDEKYKKNNKTKRDFIKRFIKIISTANLKLEKCIFNELERKDFIIENIYYKRRDAIKENGIFNSVEKAVKDRDDITHNNTVKLDGISIGIYEIVLKLNYVMIMDYIGVPVEIYGKRIQHLSLINII
ncbi:MAG: hypothetical protein ACI33S_01560 [Bacilli bacterium]